LAVLCAALLFPSFSIIPQFALFFHRKILTRAKIGSVPRGVVFSARHGRILGRAFFKAFPDNA
jgi:hypothetical protein